MFLSTPKFLVVDLSCYEDSRRFLTVAECLKVLKRSTSLKECHLDSVYSPEIFPSPMPLDRFHSKLEHLDTTLIRWAAVSLFDSITLPSVNFASAIQKISSWWCILFEILGSLYFSNSLGSILKPRRVWQPLARGHLVGDIPQQPAKKRNAIPIATLSAVKVVSHARYELTDDIES